MGQNERSTELTVLSGLSPQPRFLRATISKEARMSLEDGQLLRLPATDLTTVTDCEHASCLEIDRTLGRSTPDRGRDAAADLLAKLGRRHEVACQEYLRAQGLRVERMEPYAADAADRLRACMRRRRCDRPGAPR